MRAAIIANRSSGRGRLPTWVVRMRSVLRFMVQFHCGKLPHTKAVQKLSMSAATSYRVTTMRKLLQGALLLCGAWIGLAAVLPARAQSDFPSRPIRMYVPFPPGGGIDVTARIFADKAAEILGQQIAIINQGGGGGAIATDAVVRAEPDGYTLLYHSVTGIVHASVTPDLSYDWLRDLAPVSLVTRFAPVLIVTPSLPVKDMKDFIALLKANPGKYSY